MLVRKSDMGEIATKPAASSWTENGVKAMTENPAYFLWWYSVKSVGLGVMVGVSAYLLGYQRGANSKR